MKLTHRGDYGLRALLALCSCHGCETRSLRRIAAEEHIPSKFLEQIMMLLKKAGLVQSTHGKHGGYRLARPPREITLGEAVRAMEGPLAPWGSGAELERQFRNGDRHPGLYRVLWDVRNAIAGILDRATLADICEKSEEIVQQRSGTPMFYI